MGGKEVKVRPRYALTWRIRDFVLLSFFRLLVFSPSPLVIRLSLLARRILAPPPPHRKTTRSFVLLYPSSFAPIYRKGPARGLPADSFAGIRTSNERTRVRACGRMRT